MEYDPEAMDRAMRVYQDRIDEHGESKLTARTTVGELSGINPDTLRNWVEREEIDTGTRPGTTSHEAAEPARLSRLHCASPVLDPAGGHTADPAAGAGDRDRSE